MSLLLAPRSQLQARAACPSSCLLVRPVPGVRLPRGGINWAGLECPAAEFAWPRARPWLPCMPLLCSAQPEAYLCPFFFFAICSCGSGGAACPCRVRPQLVASCLACSWLLARATCPRTQPAIRGALPLA